MAIRSSKRTEERQKRRQLPTSCVRFLISVTQQWLQTQFPIRNTERNPNCLAVKKLRGRNLIGYYLTLHVLKIVITCHVQDLIPNPLRSGWEDWERSRRKAHRAVFNNAPSNSSSYLRIFFFICFSFYSSLVAVPVDELLHSSFLLFMPWHSEVRAVNNQEAGRERFLCSGTGVVRKNLCAFFQPPTLILGHFWTPHTLEKQ